MDDLFVLYLREPAEQELVGRLVAVGGARVPAHNPYWDEYGVTIADPDGYRLVLCSARSGSAFMAFPACSSITPSLLAVPHCPPKLG